VYLIEKHVQWKGLPPIEEDDKKVRKVMKDAPQGVEATHVEDDLTENMEE
jgi:hypothetical protein